MSQDERTLDGFLLDLNILRAWRNESHSNHASVIARVTSLGPAPLFLSIVTLGEVEFGHRIENPLAPANVGFSEFIADQFPEPLEIRRSTIEYYGEIRARLFEKFAPKGSDGKRRRGLRVAQLNEPMTDHALGVDENDVWIAAHALEYDLTLVTHDKMCHIRDVTSDLLRIQDWRVQI